MTLDSRASNDLVSTLTFVATISSGVIHPNVPEPVSTAVHVCPAFEGAAFYASGNITSEALRHYCTDLWTGTYA